MEINHVMLVAQSNQSSLFMVSVFANSSTLWNLFGTLKLIELALSSHSQTWTEWGNLWVALGVNFQVRSNKTTLTSFYSFHIVNKYLVCNSFIVIFFFFFAFLCFFLITLSFKVAPRFSAEVLASVPKLLTVFLLVHSKKGCDMPYIQNKHIR